MQIPLRLPLIPALITYTFGLYIGHFNLLPFHQRWIFLFLILLICWSILIWKKKVRWGSVMALLIYFLLGGFSIYIYLNPPFPSTHISQYIGYERISLEGVIDQAPERIQGRVHLVIRLEKIILSNSPIPVEGRLLLILKNENRSLGLGDRVRFLGTLHAPHGFHNPGRFSYERHLTFDRIYTIGYLSHDHSWVKLGEGFKNPVFLQIEKWREYIRNFLEKESEYTSSAIFKALVLGEQGDISEEVKEHFIKTGIAHLLAISGDHLGIVALLSFSLLIWVFKRSEWLMLSISVKKLAAGITIPCILLYTFIAGGGISVVRATMMVITFFFSLLFNRERNLLYTLALAGFLILLFSPPSLFDVSFQLSFLSVLSILYLVPHILQGLKKEEVFFSRKMSWRQILLKYLKLSLVATAVAILGTSPFVALHFNRISPMGFITNLFFIPWVGFLIVPISLTASLFSFFFYPLATFLIHINEWVTLVLLKTVAFFASLPFASFYISTPTIFEIILFYVLLFSGVHFKKWKSARYLFLIGCFLLSLNLAYWNLKGYFQKDLTLTFIDVGHGDSILLEFPKGKKMLIDGGGLYEDRFDIGKNVVAPFLWKKKIRRIDFLVLTHPDPDHLKGLIFITSHFSIGQFWGSSARTDSEYFQQLEKILLRKNIQRFTRNENSPPELIQAVQIAFLNPPEKKKSTTSPLNNDSLVMKIQFKKIHILLPGDIETEAEDRMLRAGFPLKADILKVPHHGSRSSNTVHFLQNVNPTYAIFSVGKHNIGNLPHPEVLERYNQLGAKIYRTDQHGAITLRTDGEKINIKTFLTN